MLCQRLTPNHGSHMKGSASSCYFVRTHKNLQIKPGPRLIGSHMVLCTLVVLRGQNWGSL